MFNSIEKIRRKKVRIIISTLREGKYMEQAINAAGYKSRATIYFWRKKPRTFSRFWHLRLGRLIEASMNMADGKRTDAVESAFFRRLIDGTAGSAEYFFYLCNRAGDRWKNQTAIANALVRVENNVNANVQINHEQEFIKSLPEKDLDDLCDRLIERRKDTTS